MDGAGDREEGGSGGRIGRGRRTGKDNRREEGGSGERKGKRRVEWGGKKRGRTRERVKEWRKKKRKGKGEKSG